MSRYLITSFIVSIIFVLAQDQTKRTQIIYDEQKKITTVLLPAMQLSGPQDRYHSLAFKTYYFYPGREPTPPEDVHFELVSVVKVRRLNSDLYVVFVIDGKPVHFSSNRSAIRNPVPGKPWVGERMDFVIPREEFLKMADAEKLGVKLGGVNFEFNEDARSSINEFAKQLRL